MHTLLYFWSGLTALQQGFFVGFGMGVMFVLLIIGLIKVISN
jgi:hypothetical protein